MRFKVNDYNWTINYAPENSPEFENDRDEIIMGITRCLQQAIYIREGMSPELTRKTVIHELCHCFLFSHGMQCNGYSEERLCEFFGAYADRILEITERFVNKKGKKTNVRKGEPRTS